MLNILVICTGNSCRSVLGEALLNHLGHGRIEAFSAGSHPIGRVNPDALATLQRHGLAADGYKSQSWHEFTAQSIDIVITVCDNARGEACPSYLHSAIQGHWGLYDPSQGNASGNELITAFDDTFQALETRIQKMLALPLETMSSVQLSKELNTIGVSIN